MRREALELLCRIQARLNPEEEPHKKLNELLIGVELTTTETWDDQATPPSSRGEMVQAAIDKVVPALQVILKAEWEQVKRESYVDPHMALGSAAASRK